MRSVQLLGKGCIPQNEFFEIEFDNGNLKGTEIEYDIDGKIEKLSCMGKINGVVKMKSSILI